MSLVAVARWALNKGASIQPSAPQTRNFMRHVAHYKLLQAARVSIAHRRGRARRVSGDRQRNNSRTQRRRKSRHEMPAATASARSKSYKSCYYRNRPSAARIVTTSSSGHVSNDAQWRENRAIKRLEDSLRYLGGGVRRLRHIAARKYKS